MVALDSMEGFLLHKPITEDEINSSLKDNERAKVNETLINAASALAKECTQAQALPIPLVGAIKKYAIDTANKTRQVNNKVKPLMQLLPLRIRTANEQC